MLFVIALLLGAPAFAQSDHATQAEIAAYAQLHNKALSQLNALVPRVQWPQDKDATANLEACRAARAGADASLPDVRSLLERLQAADPLRTTGDSDRDMSFRVTHTELIKTVDYFQTALTELSSACAAAEQGDMEKAYGAALIMVDVILKIQESGSISIRSAKGEPGPPAKKAAVEGLALSTDGVGIMSRYLFGKSEAKDVALKLAQIAADIRIQADLIREGYAANPASAGAAFGRTVANARSAFPSKLEKVAAIFEEASALLLSGNFTEENADAFFPDVQATGIGKGYNTAWAQP